ncbi:choice-of-anchor I family protein [Nodosilinea sp. FACHB-13]|nr:choice-of-anchor I family protein [Nodosilinea sp. FACHB-13]MBD2107154.1 choice-of-anchor I family protein [Nodosilinea sp. FACHB-13]
MADFTLQLFHAADQEGNITALDDASRFSAVLNALKNQDIDGDGVAGFANTLILSSGDAYIPGVFFNASTDAFGGAGRGDILIQNALGFQAIAFGNHEFDQGTALVADLIGGSEDDPTTEIDESFTGTAFPYLSGNLDFSTDANLADLVVPDAAAPRPNGIAASTVIEVNGERIGVVGATTPTISNVNVRISNPGTVTVLPQPFDSSPTPEQLDALAAEIQADIDALLAANSDIDKVVLLAHMQQIAIEQELAQRLSNVDIIVAGGSNTRLFDENDRPRANDTNQGIYPIIQTGADGNPIAVVNTDGNYKYVGRLVVDFDENGVLLPESYDPTVSGAYATDEAGVAAVGGEGLTDPAIAAITAALREAIIATESNVFGVSEVFLNGNRGAVRTQETNLGNLTADANLAIAKEVDPTAVISLKNGGGIRNNIGQTLVPAGGTGDAELLPNEEIPGVKPAGGISQNDVANALSFNNALSLITVTAEELLALVEHGVSASSLDDSVSPGQFPQIGGFSFSFDVTAEPGNRVQSLAIEAEDGTDIDVVVQNGEIVGDPSRTFRMVTLSFLADGGDGYPFPTGDTTSRVDLVNETATATGNATFAPDFSEQDALAEYLFDNFGAETPFAAAETGRELDSRIQNLAFRSDGVVDDAGPVDPTDPTEPTEPGVDPASLLVPLGTYETGVFDASAAEIVVHDPDSQRLFVVNAQVPSVEVLDISDPSNPTKLFDIDPSAYGAGANSVAISNGIVAVAIESAEKTDPGSVVFFDIDGNFLNAVTVGALPDMLTFTPDGTRVLVANEGEPNADYTIDPEGSISIIDLSGGVANLTQANVTTADFTVFNAQRDALVADGVRIFGPNATVAQDVEPEYIAVTGDSSTAYVALQENNALAVVDIASGTVTDILPLGVKNHNQPTVTQLETYEFTDLPVLGTTAAGQEIPLGGFSGLTFEGYTANGNLKFITHTDRGPNGEPTGINRPFLLPDFAPEIIRFELDRSTGALALTERIQLQSAPGDLLTGLPNTAISDNASQPYNDEVPVDLQGNVLKRDALGADLEGIVTAPDGTFWMVDEYRPAIYHFDSSGVLIDRFVPEGTAAAVGEAEGTFGTEALPAVLAQRRQNRGFEGVAFQDGKVYAFVQSPIRNPDTLSNGVLNGSTNIRIVEFDPTTQTTRQFLYQMDNGPAVSETDSRADKIGDAVAIGNGEFLVLERDDDAIDSDPLSDIQKKIYRFSLGDATDITGLDDPIDGKTVDQMTAAELAAAGIKPINKTLHVDLAAAGYDTVEKVEGLTIVDSNTLAVVNDNDFTVAGITIDPATGTFTPDPNAETPTLGLLTLRGNGLDASDRDDAINIQKLPVFGLYLPDAISLYEAGGETYIVTANEGDAREYDTFAEEARVKDLALDPVAFPNAAELQADEVLGRLTVTTTLGDTDGDGDYDELYAFGGRSFSIWNTQGNLVYDSGAEFEQTIAELFPTEFNADNSENGSFDSRSDNKGPEPEGVTIGEVDGRTYAFIGLERFGGVMTYDITNPAEAFFVDFVNNRDFAGDAEAGTASDLGAEGLVFIPAAESPNGSPLVIVANEVSGSTTVFDASALEALAPDVPGEEVSDFLLDLRDITGDVTTTFSVNREAAFDNFVGLYQIADLNGGIDLNGDGSADVTPGQSGYTEAALANRAEAVALTTANLTTSVFESTVAGGSLYAPFLIANGNLDSFNSNEVYFAFGSANADGVEHIRVIDGAIGFEDLFGGGDNDFNDIVVKVAVSV